MIRYAALTLVALLALGAPAVSRASTIGPACWRMLIPAAGANPGATSDFVLIFSSVTQSTDPAVPSTASVSGVHRVPGADAVAPITGSALEGGRGIVSMALTVMPVPGRGPLFANVIFALSNLNGQGFCTGGSGICGEGRDLVWVSMACELLD